MFAEGDRTARRMARVGERVHPAFARRHAVDHLAHRVGDADAAERDVAAGDALRELHDVRLDAVVLQPEPAAGAAEAGDHFVGDQQHVVARADLADAREVVGGRDDDAAGALDRLGDERGDGVGALAQDRLFELVGGGDAEADARASVLTNRYGSGASMCRKPGVRGSNIGQNAGRPVALIAASVRP